MEQKNGAIVRRAIGRDRYSSKQAYETLNRIYYFLRLYVNFLQPVVKLVAKTHYGARVHRVYDIAQTPYQRVLKAADITDAEKVELCTIYAYLNPVKLLQQINGNLEVLWKLRDRHPGDRTVPIIKTLR